MSLPKLLDLVEGEHLSGIGERAPQLASRRGEEDDRKRQAGAKPGPLTKGLLDFRERLAPDVDFSIIDQVIPPAGSIRRSTCSVRRPKWAERLVGWR